MAVRLKAPEMAAGAFGLSGACVALWAPCLLKPASLGSGLGHIPDRLRALTQVKAFGFSVVGEDQRELRWIIRMAQELGFQDLEGD